MYAMAPAREPAKRFLFRAPDVPVRPVQDVVDPPLVNLEHVELDGGVGGDADAVGGVALEQAVDAFPSVYGLEKVEAGQSTWRGWPGGAGTVPRGWSDAKRSDVRKGPRPSDWKSR